jgi:hypothetical protein
VEVARRAKDKALADPSVREAVAQWYNPATLKLLEGSPVNCILLTLSAGVEARIEQEQKELVKEYARAAHSRGLVVLGLVFPGADPASAAGTAAGAGLDALVLEGDFQHGYLEKLQKELSAAKAAPVVIPILTSLAAARASGDPVVAVEGVSPSARNLAELGIRGAPSSEPWIETNIWRVRSLRLDPAWRPIWISQRPESASAQDYIRCVADAAVAGGRWIVALDDPFRAKWSRGDPETLAAWKRIGVFLKFAEEHPEWRKAPSFGNLAIILDVGVSDTDIADEYLNLVARRQVAYRVIVRSRFGAAALAGLRAVLATELAPPTAQERQLLQDFAEKGGVVVAGPSWGNPPEEDGYEERPAGKGRVVVYKDPDPETVARDMKDLLSQDEMGIVAFNVPSVIMHASAGEGGKCSLIQLLNYFDSPSTAITIRVNGETKRAQLLTPESQPSDLKLRHAEGRTDIFIPTLSSWGGLVLE